MGSAVRQKRGKTIGERRSRNRYPVSSDLEYRVLGGAAESGRGRTANMSAGGILFESAQPLPVGSDIELDIAWPARLDATVPLKLCVFGCVVRCTGSLTAVRILRYGFRTAKKASLT